MKSDNVIENNCELQNRKTILLVEDEKKVQNYNKHLLEKQGFIVETAMTLVDARAYLARRQPDIIVLDRGMPDGEGLCFLRELRSGKMKSKNCTPCTNCELCIVNCELYKVPVLLLTGYGEDKDVEYGFDSGCDDYLAKPYTFGVLHKRLIRLLQRAEQVPEIVTRGRLTLKISSMIALLGDVDILLTQKEFALLMLFIQNEGKIMGAEYLYEKVWGQDMIGEFRAVKQQISNLREKTSGSGYVITTVRGAGYRFEREQ